MRSLSPHVVRVSRSKSPVIAVPVATFVAMAFAILPARSEAESRGVAAAVSSERETPATSGEQTPAKVDVRPAIGEWRSREQFDHAPRATVVVHNDAATLAGSLTLLGITRGADDRATLKVPFRGAVWDGTTLTFETALPDNEGASRWTLRLLPAGTATLFPIGDDGKPVEDGPMWEMVRQ
jgi:hypothetical protein